MREAVPPFRPLAVAPFPLFTLTEEEAALKPDKQLNPAVDTCIYPCGALADPDSNTLLITYGINDFRSGFRYYDLNRLTAALRPVARKV